jgi:tRNA-splicing ligase RtcB
VRLLTANISAQEIKLKLEDLATELFHTVPSGVGRGGRIKIKDKELDKVLSGGAPRLLSLGYGTDSDIENCEENGVLKNANPDLVSDKAKQRGYDQLGTLGSGNHFLEIQYVEEVFDEAAAQIFGIKKDQVTIMIHCGSRGLGHQTCTDYVKNMLPNLEKWKIKLPDPELACAPFNSKEGQQYFDAMAACANFAWANRHVIGHQVRESFSKVFGSGILVKTVYDVSHNIGKKEIHEINGKQKELIVHRKGATRSFPGQPVLIPGTMGTSSYILSGTESSMEQSFGSCCHGAGRRLSRIKAKKTVRGTELRKNLEKQGIIIKCDSDPGLAEEAPSAYKDVEDVIEVVSSLGLASRVAKLKPIAVIKGG